MPEFEKNPPNKMIGITNTGESCTAVSGFLKTLESMYPKEEAQNTSNTVIKEKMKYYSALNANPTPK